MPDPRDAAAGVADAFARAAETGDADSIYEMLDEESRRALTRGDVKRLVGDQQRELSERARALRSKDARVRTIATIRFADGEEAALSLSENGYFRVDSVDAVPARARTPVQALDLLRRVLARRSYQGFLRVLSTSTRRTLEADMRSLVEGLANPEELDARVDGDFAVVRVPGGRLIRLRREEGIWRVDDIE